MLATWKYIPKRSAIQRKRFRRIIREQPKGLQISFYSNKQFNKRRYETKTSKEDNA